MVDIQKDRQHHQTTTINFGNPISVGAILS